MATSSDERWGIWITQDKPRRGQSKPDAYWWQGPDYYGDCIMTKAEAEAEARIMRAECPAWSYEARLYVPRP